MPHRRFIKENHAEASKLKEEAQEEQYAQKQGERDNNDLNQAHSVFPRKESIRQFNLVTPLIL
jgi:hypothetical protein